MVRVLIVDDSTFARLSITKQLESDPDIKIAGYARDGVEAIEKVKELKPDVITLDVRMPRMDGLEALKRIMTESPAPVVMLSSLTDAGTDITIRALEIGAIDFFLKTSPATPVGRYGQENSLNTKVKLASKARPMRLRQSTKTPEVRPRSNIPLRRPPSSRSRVVVIGCSTGGPGALYQIVPALPADIQASVLIVQHMPPKFTRSLAERLNEISQIEVREAQSGDPIIEGQVLVAPGNYHMVAKTRRIIGLNQQPPVLGLRPSANVTMQSVARVYGSKAIGVVLTGMGSDGTEGTASIKASGGITIAQDESSCVVYGMPRSVIESGNADKVMPLAGIADEIISLCQE